MHLFYTAVLNLSLERVPSMSIPTSILCWMQLNEAKLINFMEFETHGILLQNAFLFSLCSVQ